MLMQRVSHDTNKILLPNNNFKNTLNNFSLRQSLQNNINMQHQQQQKQPTPQQQHINQLLSTAAAGAGIVGDVDALLTPLHSRNADVTSTTTAPLRLTARVAERPERNLWRLDEILQMLNIMQNINALEQLNDKTVKSEKVFVHIEELMQKLGYRKKSHIQIWTKWKFLKSTYTTSKRNGVVPKMIPYQVYEELHKMLHKDGAGSSAASASNASDCGNSTTSMDGETADAAGLMLQQAKPEVTTVGNTHFGMAHPIFGFRLGLVKQEPIDAGYETNNNSECNLYANNVSKSNGNPTLASQSIAFRSEIKVEPMEHTFFEEPQHIAEKPTTMPAAVELIKRPVEVTPIISNTTSSTKLPPLRIANFAKTHSANALKPEENLAVTVAPALSLQMFNKNAGRILSTAHTSFNQHLNHNSNNNNNSSSGNSSFKNNHFTASIQNEMCATLTPIKHTKEIMIQSRGSSMHAPSRQKTTNMSIRKMPFAVKPERVLPDLTLSNRISPPIKQNTTPKYVAPFMPEIPSTSKQAMLANQNNVSLSKKRKRPLEIPNDMEVRPVVKRTNYYYKTPVVSKANEMADSDSDSQQNSFEKYEAAVKQISNKRKQRLVQKTLDSMREMQSRFLVKFFEQQKQLIAKEHEFLLQQDQFLIAAFTEQRKKLNVLAKKLLKNKAANGSNTNNNISAQKNKKMDEAVSNFIMKLPAKSNGLQQVNSFKPNKLQQLLYDNGNAEVMATLYNNNNSNNKQEQCLTEENSEESTTDDDEADDDSSSDSENDDDNDDDEDNGNDNDEQEKSKLAQKQPQNKNKTSKQKNANNKSSERMDPIELDPIQFDPIDFDPIELVSSELTDD